MFAEERRQVIVRDLHERGRVEVAELAQRLGVAEETIRRDLRWLENLGQAVRTHGGAVRTATVVPPFAERAGVSREAKRAIGEVAAKLVGEGESILIDSGSTALEVARALRRKMLEEGGARGRTGDLHVLTNSLLVAGELVSVPGIVVNVTGGTLRAAELCLVGPEAVAALGRYRLDRAFVACAGLDFGRGLAVSNPFEAEVKRAMLQGATMRVVVADSSKIGRTAMIAVAGLESVDVLVTDSDADPEFIAEVKELGVHVELA